MRHIPTGAALAVALAVSLMACGDDTPTQPTSPPPPPPGPTVTSTRIELTGPESVPPGGTAQFGATAHLSDGATQDVTSQATWRSGHTGILTVSSTGLVTGRQRGETSLSAAYGGRLATRNEVLVLPAGTYRVIGTVRDAGFPMTGAQITVTGGSAVGLTAGASPDYRLYGVAGPTELGATRNGYNEQKQRLDVAGHQRVDFDLTLSGPRTQAAGRYTLEVSADARCRDRLPESARTRRYLVDLVQNGPHVAATLSGVFRTYQGRLRNTFNGTTEPGGAVSFTLGSFCEYDYDYDYYNDVCSADVMEEIAPATSLVITGWASVRDSGSMMSGALSGSITTYDANLRPTATCSAGRHRFVFSK